MRKVVVVLAWIIGLYLIVRAAVEPFTIDLGDANTYEDDWGGPSLAGVLVVHCGPGIVAAALMVRSALRRRGGETSGPAT